MLHAVIQIYQNLQYLVIIKVGALEQLQELQLLVLVKQIMKGMYGLMANLNLLRQMDRVYLALTQLYLDLLISLQKEILH